ncbi:MAG: type IV secretion system DNA-binding domain-containing protein [Patescibacteria group bacterium]|nr:type IV secretion system DNA-binding domain-containing protein [Patescibacteria group bacterium]
MSLSLVILILVIVFLIFVCFLIFLQRKKSKGFLFRSLELSLFLVTLPQEIIKEKGKEFSLQDYLKNVEHFYSSLAGIKEKSFLKRFFFGNPYLVFEIAVHRIGEEIYFYVACPRYLTEMIEKQILGFWPKAQVQLVPDYNIFNPEGRAVGSTAVLTKSSVFPLKPYQEFTTDPLSAITSVFTKLAREGEGAALQILIRSSKRRLEKTAEKTINFLLGIKKEKDLMSEIVFSEGKKEKDIKPAFLPQPTPIQQTQISAISQKASQPLFDTNLRILASAPTERRALEILNQLQNSFNQLNSPILNQIKFRKLSSRNLKKLFYRFSFRIFNERESLLLSSGELASIFHFPSPILLTPHIKWLKAKQAPPPSNLPTQGIILGKNVFRTEERVVSILKDDRRRHFYIVGQTGTGKSVLLQEMIRQDIENGEGVALIDPHGDLSEKILELIPAERVEDVVYFNPADFERPLGLNMLEYDPKYPEAKTFVVNELLEIFEKLYNLKAHGFGGPIFEQYMRNSLLLVMEDPESGNTLVEVPKVLSDTNFRKYKLSKCQNIVVKNFWELEAEKAGGEAALANMVPYITSKMNIFIANDLMRPIISQPKSGFNFREIMDEGKILIINLCKGKLGDINSYLLGMIIVGKILISALSRVDIPEEKRRDFYLYIDEFHNVTTKTITTVLAEARKYHLAMIFGHQYVGQLDEDTQKAIFGNVGSILAFRVGPDDAKYLVTQFEPVFDENDLVNFDNYNAALRLLIKGETSKPFNILTFPPSKGNPEVARLIKEYSRTKYGKDRALVESELYQRLSKNYL